MRVVDELATSGRLGRSGFWGRHLLVLPAALFVCVAATDLLGRPLDVLPALLTTVFLVSVWGRRLHDRGRSAWWLLVVAVPVLGALWLMVECALRGSSAAAQAARHGPPPGGPRPDYVTVGAGAPATESAR